MNINDVHIFACNELTIAIVGVSCADESGQTVKF